MKLDKYDEEAEAEKLVAFRLTHPPKGYTGWFDDLHFHVIIYTAQEMREQGVPVEDRKWAGQYSAGSIVDQERGLTVLLNLSQHKNRQDMADTIAHEIGHALWELLDPKDRKKWERKHADERWGAQEAFADELMYLLRGDRHVMTDEDMFKGIVAPTPAIIK